MSESAFESSGSIKRPSAGDLTQADKDLTILGYVHGAMEDGRPYYAYVAILPSKYREFHAVTAARTAMIIGEYGTVVAAGFEVEPPAEVVKEIREVYGFDEQFETKLKQEAIQQREAFFKHQEETRIVDIVAMLKNQYSGNS